MTPGLAALVRRCIGAFGVLAGLAATLPTQAAAQPAASQSLLADVERVGVLIRDGRNLDAADLVKRVAAAAPPSERQFIYQWAGWVCRVTVDIDCARDILATTLPHIDALLKTPGADRSSVYHNLLLMASYQVDTGHYETVADFLTADAIVKAASAVQDPLLFAELQLLAARGTRRISNFEASRDHVDKALIATFSLTGPSRSDAPRLLVRIIRQLAENYDTERALRLLAAADPLLNTIPPNSSLSFEFLWLRAELMGHGRDYAGAAKVLRLACRSWTACNSRRHTSSPCRCLPTTIWASRC